jgi:predicted N-acyltransferase
MQIEMHGRIDALGVDEWDRLVPGQPFLRHAFLDALARHGAVGGDSGWHPRYLVAREAGRLLGAVPLFLKEHSFGEFIFDWAWADAYRRYGLEYYPKLVAAAPYTPASGDRILLAPDIDSGIGAGGAERVSAALIGAALDHARQSGASSLHWLFTSERDDDRLRKQGFMSRASCQFHWRNDGYADFDAFLATLSSRHRKKIRAERKAVYGQGVEVRVLGGAEATPALWDAFHGFYLSTFVRKGNHAPLTRGFFRDIGAALGGNTLLVLAFHGGRPVAGAFFFVADDALYGRHWGRSEGFHGLHFELCYYRAIEYCIEHGLRRFEAGAQGEYKVQRGFAPTLTRSAHWIADAAFATAIDGFLAQERDAVAEYMREMAGHLPYRSVHA